MSDTRQAFLAAIRANPDDDLPRLVMADWLDENGEPERAEYIRYAVTYPHAEFAWLTAKNDPFPFIGLEAGEAKPINWHPQNPNGLPDDPVRTWMWGDSGEPWGCVIHDTPRQLDYKIHRGFVTMVRGTFASWLAHAPAILPESVGLTVRLTDRPVIQHASKPGDDHLYAILEGTADTGGMGWKLPSGMGWKLPTGCRFIPVGHQQEIIDGLLRGNWPDVAAWELPPEPTIRAEDIQQMFHRRVTQEMRLAAQIDERRILNGNPDAGRPLGVLTYRPPRS